MKWFLNIFIYFYRFVSFLFSNAFRGVYSLVYHFFYGIYYIIKSLVSFMSIAFRRKPKDLRVTNSIKKDDEYMVNGPNSPKSIREAKKIEKEASELRKLPIMKRIFKIISSKFENSRMSKHKKNKEEMQREALAMTFDSDETEKSEKKRTYIYEARDADGKYVVGKFDAFSKVDVHSFLINEGYEVYSIKTSKYIDFVYGSSSLTSAKYSKKELIFFLTQLSTYIKAGLPLIDAIRIFAKQEKKMNKRKVLQGIVYELVMGESFSNALEKQGNAFPRLLINMIKTAEMTGELADTLDDMGNYYEEMEKTRKQMISAMTYPSIVFVMSIAIITFIMLFVIPQFVEIYNDMEATIPGITLFVIAVSDFLGNYWMYVFGGLILGVIILILMYKKIKLFRTMVQYITMRIPIFGKIIIYNEVATFTKTFGSLLNHNVYITDSMEILSKITNNEIYKMIIFDTLTNLSKGESVSTAFKDHWAFPVVAYEMILTGERTGELGKMMNKVSEFYQEQHSNLVTQMKSFIEPIMIAFLAFMVGGLLLSVVIPMFSLYNQIG